MSPSPRSRRPSAEVQAARRALLADGLRNRVEQKRRVVRTYLGHLGAREVKWTSRGLSDVLTELREAYVQVEILIELTGKLEREATHE